MVRHATPVRRTYSRDRPDDLRLHPLAEAGRALLPVRGDDALPLVRSRADLLVVPGRAAVGCGPGRAGLADEDRRRAPGHLVCRHQRKVAARPDPGQSLRGDSVAACRLRLPDLPLCHHARLAHALALVDRPPGRALRRSPVVRGRLHGEPLRGRCADRFRLRRGGTLGGLLALAPDELVKLERLTTLKVAFPGELGRFATAWQVGLSQISRCTPPTAGFRAPGRQRYQSPACGFR
jgi:hypothetical protein